MASLGSSGGRSAQQFNEEWNQPEVSEVLESYRPRL